MRQLRTAPRSAAGMRRGMPVMAKRDYYEVRRDARRERRRRRLRIVFAMRTIRTAIGDKDCEHKFKELNEAYDVLKDADKRAAHERFGHRVRAGHGRRCARLWRRLRLGLLRHLRRHLREGGARQRTSGRGAARTSASTWNHAGRRLFRQDRADAAPTSVTCETCSGSGKAGTKPKTSTATASRIRHTQGGFFTLERTCPICQAAAR